MKNTLLMSAVITTMMLAAPAFADEVKSETKTHTKIEKKDDGSYKRKSSSEQSSTDSAGTYTKTETDVNVKADADGDAEKTVKTTETEDPKGLMNKTKTVTTDKAEYDNGKLTTKHQKKVNGKTVEDTAQESNPAENAPAR